MRTVGEKQVNVVACYLSGHNLPFMCYRNLPQQITPTKSDLTSQHRFAVLRYPDQMHFQVALRVRTKSIMPHATT